MTEWQEVGGRVVVSRGTWRTARLCVAATWLSSSALGQPTAQPVPPPIKMAAALQPGGLQSGGLQAPLAPPQASETLRKLQRAEVENTGRGLQFIWLDAAAGYRHLWLQALSGDNLLPAESDSASEGAFNLEVAAGIRLVFLTAGARLRRASTTFWDLWSVGGEVGLHIPLGHFEPSASVSLGYAWLSGVQARDAMGTENAIDLDIGGPELGVAAQWAWYPRPFVSLALRSDVSLLVLSRDGLQSPAPNSALAGNSSAIGLSASLQSVLGLHF